MDALPKGPPCGGIGARLLFFIAIVFACLALGWMLLLPSALGRLVRKRTGFGVEVQTLYLNPFTASAAASGVTITNPPGFPRKDFVAIRGVRARAQLVSLFGQHPVIDEAVVDVVGITLVKDARGVINARLFQDGWSGPARGPDPAAAAAGPRREFLIRRLQLRCDRLVIADYSKATPEVREFDLNFNHTYENVRSATDLAGPLAEALAPIAGAIGNALPDADPALRRAADRIVDTGRRTGEAVKELFEALEKSLKK